MAATNHTENLGLNLWEPQDYILREDFNENNRKIDEAVSAVMPRQKLAEIVTQQAGTSVEIDVSGIDWGSYNTVIFETEFVNTANSASTAAVEVKSATLNYISQYCVVYSRSSDQLSNRIGIHESNHNGITVIEFYVNFRPEQKTHCACRTPSGASYGWTSYVPYTEMASLIFNCADSSYPWQPGSKITVWGCK